MFKLQLDVQESLMMGGRVPRQESNTVRLMCAMGQSQRGRGEGENTLTVRAVLNSICDSDLLAHTARRHIWNAVPRCVFWTGVDHVK